VYVCIASLVVSGFRAEQGILIGDAMQNLENCTGHGMSGELRAELADRDVLFRGKHTHGRKGVVRYGKLSAALIGSSIL
jgi:hypothetical protein